MKKILITGGAGYLGSMIATSFVEKGFHVTVLDNLLFKKNTILHLLKKKNFEFINGDVRDKILYSELIYKNDIIFPLAALVGAPLCEKNKFDAIDINQKAIEYLCKIKSKDQIIFYPNTNSGYGITKKNEICTEKMSLNPISLYGITKCNAEKSIMEKENSIVFRLATVFGIGYRNRVDLLVNNFTYIALKEKKILLFEPEFRRNYIHIKDIVMTFEFCLQNFNNTKNEIYNIGLSSANLTKLALCQEIKKIIPDFDIRISKDGKDPDKRDYYVSNNKIESKGWLPNITLQEGIKELAEGYLKLKSDEFDRNY